MQEIAQQMALDKLNIAIRSKQSIAIESNLSDKETWSWLKAMNKILDIELLFITAPIEVCVKRVKTRYETKTGHFVRPDIILQRHIAGMEFLALNINEINEVGILLNDKDYQTPKLITKKEKGKQIELLDKVPEWFSLSLKEKLLDRTVLTKKTTDLTIEQIRKKYRGR